MSRSLLQPKPGLRFCSAFKMQGLSMIEILVTMVITVIVLLGLVGTQTYSFRMQSVASYQTAAALLASDLADRMRANSAAAKDFTNTPYAPPTMPTTENSCTACTADQQANNDLVRWNAELGRSLPSGSGTVSFDSVNSVYNINVSWTQPGTEGQTTGQGRAFNFSLIP